MAKKLTNTYLVTYEDRRGRLHIVDCKPEEVRKLRKSLADQGMTDIHAHRAIESELMTYERNTEAAKTGMPTMYCYDKAGVDTPNPSSLKYMEYFGQRDTDWLEDRLEVSE